MTPASAFCNSDTSTRRTFIPEASQSLTSANEVRRHQHRAANGKHVRSSGFFFLNIDDVEIAKLICIDPIAIRKNHVPACPAGSAFQMQAAFDVDRHYPISKYLRCSVSWEMPSRLVRPDTPT